MIPWWPIVFVFLLTVGCSEETPPASEPTSVSPSEGKSQQPHIAKVPEQIRGRLSTEIVQKKSFPQSFTAPGEVTLDLKRVAKVSSRIEGQVEKVFVHLGERVRLDQPLLAIGSLKLDELVQEFLVAKVKVDIAKANFERTRQLLDEKIVSERRFQEDRAKFLEAKAVHQHVTEKLKNMGLADAELRNLVRGSHIHGHRYTLKAPLSGIIASQSVVLGQGVLPGNELFKVVDTSKVWVFANLPVEQVRRFKVGDQGIIVPKGREPIEATLSYIDPLADKATLTIRLRFDVENAHEHLKPNEYVEVRLVEESASVLVIPVSAPTFIEGTRGVFIKRQEGFQFVPIELGPEADGWVEVKQGLAVGDEVVTRGVFDLKNALLRESIQGE